MRPVWLMGKGVPFLVGRSFLYLRCHHITIRLPSGTGSSRSSIAYDYYDAISITCHCQHFLFNNSIVQIVGLLFCRRSRTAVDRQQFACRQRLAGEMFLQRRRHRRRRNLCREIERCRGWQRLTGLGAQLVGSGAASRARDKSFMVECALRAVSVHACKRSAAHVVVTPSV